MHEITSRVTSDMATAGINWVKPWVNVLQHNQPMSARKHQYSGINRINLSMLMAARGYTSPVFATYNQWQSLGYELEGAKGKGIRIVFWSLIKYEDKKTGEELWAHKLPFGASAPPAIYQVRGRQYVVVPATGGGKLGLPRGDAHVAFCLP